MGLKRKWTAIYKFYQWKLKWGCISNLYLNQYFTFPPAHWNPISPPLFSTHDMFCTFFNTQNMKSKHFWPIWSFGSLNNGSNWISRLQTKFSSYIPRKFTNYILLLSRIKALYWYLEGPPNKYSYQVWFLLSKHYWRKQNHVPG